MTSLPKPTYVDQSLSIHPNLAPPFRKQQRLTAVRLTVAAGESSPAASELASEAAAAATSDTTYTSPPSDTTGGLATAAGPQMAVSPDTAADTDRTGFSDGISRSMAGGSSSAPTSNAFPGLRFNSRLLAVVGAVGFACLASFAI